MDYKINDLIHHERFIIHNIQFLLDNNLSQCRSCDEDAIKYHEKIIHYLEMLKDLLYFYNEDIQKNIALDVFLGVNKAEEIREEDFTNGEEN